jgi:hypothetical protein
MKWGEAFGQHACGGPVLVGANRINHTEAVMHRDVE